LAAASLLSKQTLDVAGSVNYVDDFNAVPFCAVENQPVFETSHRPAPEQASCRFAKPGQNTNSRHICQRSKRTEELIQEAFGDFYPRLLFQVIELRIDLAPSERPHRKLRHLLRNQFSLRITGSEPFSHLVDHLGGNLNRVSRVEGT